MRVPFNDLKLQQASLQPALNEALLKVVENCNYIRGDEIALFEQEFATFCGTAHCATVGNGTDALEAALRTLGIGPGDEVIVPAMTFVATAEPAALLGAKPVVVDILDHAYTVDPAKVAAAVTEGTRAIIPVHLYGQPCDMDPILEIAKAHNLFIVEDAAQAHGATYKGRRAGTMGDIAAFSFYPGKNLGALGDAGAVTTQSDEYILSVKRFRDHGRVPEDKFGHGMIWRNCRLDTLQAAALRVKLPHLEAWSRRRREIAAFYAENLAGVVDTVREVEGSRSVYHLFVVEVDSRADVRAALSERGVATGIHYPTATHMHPAFMAAFGYREGDCPIAERLAERGLSLPIYPEMTDAQVEYCVDAVRAVVRGR